MKILVLILLISVANIAIAKSKEYNIALTLNNDCTQIAKQINELSAASLNDIDNIENIPHISLYQIALNINDVNSIKKNLSKIDLSPFNINLKFNKHNRVIALDASDNNFLKKLHENIVADFSRYTSQPIKRMLDVYNNLSSEKQKQIDKYGVTNILEFYKPKISLFYNYSNKDPRFDNLISDIEQKFPDEIQCRAEKLVIGELGEQGNLINIVP